MASEPRYWVLCHRTDFTAEDVAAAVGRGTLKAVAKGKKNVVVEFTRKQDKRHFVLEVVFERKAHAQEVIDLLEESGALAKRKDAAAIKACKGSLIIYWDQRDWTEVWDTALTISRRIEMALGPAWTYDPNAGEWMTEG